MGGGEHRAGLGEVLVWEGRPARGIRISAFDGPLICYGLLLSVVAVGLLVNGRMPVVSLGGIVLGPYLVIGQFLVDAQRRAHTTYRLTMDHAYIVCRWPRERITTVDLRRIGPASIRDLSDGVGTIVFQPVPRLLMWIGPLRDRRPAFQLIEAPASVLRVIHGEVEIADTADQQGFQELDSPTDG